MLVCAAITMMVLPPKGEEPKESVGRSFFVPWVLRGVDAVRVFTTQEKSARIQRFVERVREIRR